MDVSRTDQVEHWRKFKQMRLGLLVSWLIVALIFSLPIYGLNPLGIAAVTFDALLNAVGSPTAQQQFKALTRSSGLNVFVRVIDIAFLGLLVGGLYAGGRERSLRLKYGLDRKSP